MADLGLYRPVNGLLWARYKEFHIIETQGLASFSQTSSVPLTSRVKIEVELLERGLPFPQVSYNIGPHGVFPIDSFIATVELQNEGVYRIEESVLSKAIAGTSYSNIEYTPYRTKRISLTQEAEHFLSDEMRERVPSCVHHIRLLAKELGLHPISLADRSRILLLDLVSKETVPFKYLEQETKGGLWKYVEPSVTVPPITVTIPPSIEENVIKRCRRHCQNIINKKEDPRMKPCIFLPQLLEDWTDGKRDMVTKNVLLVGRFTKPATYFGNGFLRSEFSISFYLKSDRLSCTTYLHKEGFNRSQLSPAGITENMFIMLGSVNGEIDDLGRPIIVANALVCARPLRDHVPRYEPDSPKYVM